jgi:uncharacterized phage protein (TIGR01671 family)
MNRTIKFRVWNEKQNKWEHGPHKYPDMDGVNLFGETILFGEFMRVPLEELQHCVALQYTGLKDKHGREIFEGDILLISDQYAECPENTLAPVQYKYGAFWWDDELLLEAAEYGEVVGNIFENPELSKQ